ncbi:MAG: tetratricopeptide repeat protein [Chitinivibrionales bacterium]|nr:tetratricopeptide repeat protein [Chitinivibrionales bacterium]
MLADSCVLLSFNGEPARVQSHYYHREHMIKATIIPHRALQWLSFWALVLGLAGNIAANESESFYKLGNRFYRDSLHSLAIEQYQKYLAIRKAPDKDAEVHYKIAKAYYLLGDVAQAVESYETFIQKYSADDRVMNAMYEAGEMRMKSGDYKKAADWFYKVWTRFVGSAKARNALLLAARCSHRANEIEQAVDLYDMYVKRFPRHKDAPKATLSLIGILYDQHDFARAETITKQAREQWSSTPEIKARLLYYSALLARSRRKKDEALDIFERMKPLFNRDFAEKKQALQAYISLLNDAGRFDAALDIFAQLNRHYESSSQKTPSSFLFAWAECARKAGKYPRAEQLYTQQLTLEKSAAKKAAIRFRIAECQAGSDKLSQALETLQMLANDDSAGVYKAKALLKAGDLHYARGIYPSAVMSYRKYLQISGEPGKDRLLFRIGSIYEHQNKRHNAAIREYEALLKDYPSSRYAHKAAFRIAKCYQELKNFQSALRQYEYVLELGVDKQLYEKTDQHITYLKNFLIKDSEAAAIALTELTQSTPSESEQALHLWKIAQIQEKHLKQYDKALSSYQKIIDMGATADSLLIPARFARANVYTKLWEKFLFENDSSAAERTKQQALDIYRTIIDAAPQSSQAQAAAFSIMMLTNPNIAEFESYVEKYPASGYKQEVLFYIGSHYEKQALATGNSALREKAIEAFQGVAGDADTSHFSVRAQLGLARNFLDLDRLDSAEQVARTYLASSTSSDMAPEFIYIRGKIAEKKGNFAQAAEMFRNVIFNYPFSARAGTSRFELAQAQFKNGKIFEALSNYRAYYADYPTGGNSGNARLGIAKCLARTGKTAEAESLLTELLSDSLDDPLASSSHFEFAELAEGEHRPFVALEHYKKAAAYESFSRKSYALSKAGELYLANRIYPDAASAYSAALNHAHNERDSLPALHGKILANVMDGKSKKVAGLISYFKDRFPGRKNSHAEIVYHEGLYFSNKKEFDKAIKRFAYVIEKFDQSELVDDAEYQIALCYYFDKKPEAAMKKFQAFVQHYPQGNLLTQAYYTIGMLHHGRDEFAPAAQAFVKVLADTAAAPKTRYRAAHNAALAYRKMLNWNEAASIYKRIASEFSGTITPSTMYLNIGFCLVQASKFEEALSWFTKANNENPPSEEKPELLYWIAMCHSKLGDIQTALTEYLKIPYLYAGVSKWGVTAEMEAARIYERMGDYGKAQNLYKKVINSDGVHGQFGKRAAERIERLKSLTEG